jgi:hypothetical protein
MFDAPDRPQPVQRRKALHLWLIIDGGSVAADLATVGQVIVKKLY